MKTIYQVQALPADGVTVTLEGKLLRVLFDFEQVEFPEGDDNHIPKADDLYYCDSIDVHGRGYGDIISAIVNDRYPTDQKDAIMANYELVKDDHCPEEKKAEYISEYQALQDWRARAKEIAKIITSKLDS